MTLQNLTRESLDVILKVTRERLIRHESVDIPGVCLLSVAHAPSEIVPGHGTVRITPPRDFVAIEESEHN